MRELEKSWENSRLTPSASTGTKGDRFNSGKPEISMVLEARHAMEGAARVLEFGKRKYTKRKPLEEWIKDVPNVTLDKYRLEDFVKTAMTKFSNEKILSTKNAKDKIVVNGLKETKITYGNTKNNTVNSPMSVSECLKQNSSDVSKDTDSPWSYIERFARQGVWSPDQQYVYTLTIATYPGISEEFFVVSAIKDLDCLTTILNVLKERQLISVNTRLFDDGQVVIAEGRGNWRKGLSHTQTSDCLLRHLTKWLAGEDNDDETGLPHLDHVLVNALFLSELSRTHPELDDRYLPNEGTKNVEAVSKAPLPPKQLELLLQGGRIDPDKFPKHYEYQQLGKSKPDDYDPYRICSGSAGDSKL